MTKDLCEDDEQMMDAETDDQVFPSFCKGVVNHGSLQS